MHAQIQCVGSESWCLLDINNNVACAVYQKIWPPVDLGFRAIATQQETFESSRTCNNTANRLSIELTVVLERQSDFPRTLRKSKLGKIGTAILLLHHTSG
jgi:hypothetical protein